ncbi:hypothetical protein QEN19_001673 [Hanseniaspora menglaensis]
MADQLRTIIKKLKKNSKYINIVVILSVIYYFALYRPFSELGYGRDEGKNAVYKLPTSLNKDSAIYEPLTPSKLLSEQYDLRNLMDLEFPYDPMSSTPKFIWQTYKTHPETDKDFKAEYRSFMKSWKKKLKYNPFMDFNFPVNGLQFSDTKNNEWTYYYMSDEDVEGFVERTFKNLEPIVWAFKEMPASILKADFFRYLIIYARGGIYSDVDTILMKSLPEWPGNNYHFLKDIVSNQEDRVSYSKPEGENKLPDSYEMINTPGLVLGIEADPDRADWADYYARRIQFCQWTIQSKPGHPVLRELILNITATTLASTKLKNSAIKNRILFEKDNEFKYKVQRRNKKNNNNIPKNAKNTDGTDIMNWTGPGIFTDTVTEYFEYLINNYNNVNIFNTNLNIEHVEGDDELKKSTQKFKTQIIEAISKLTINWGFFSLMQKPVLISDVVILPITAFSPDVGHMGSKSSGSDECLVKHFFSGSWKGE